MPEIICIECNNRHAITCDLRKNNKTGEFLYNIQCTCGNGSGVFYRTKEHAIREWNEYQRQLCLNSLMRKEYEKNKRKNNMKKLSIQEIKEKVDESKCKLEEVYQINKLLSENGVSIDISQSGIRVDVKYIIQL